MPTQNIYQPLVGQPRPGRLATIADFLGGFQQAREQRQVNKDREEDRALRAQDRQLRGQEIALRQSAVETAAKDEAAVRAAFAEFGNGPDGPDMKAIITKLYQTASPATAQKVETVFNERKKAAQAEKVQELDVQAKRKNIIGGLLRGVKDDATFQMVLPIVQAVDPDTAKQLGPAFDAQRVGLLADSVLTDAEYRTKYQDILKKGDDDEKKALNLMSLGNAERWDDAWDFARAHGVAAKLRGYGLKEQFDDQQPTLAGNLLMTPDQRADNARTASGGGTGSDYARFEADYLTAEAERLGKTVDKLSAAERVKLKEQARKKFGQADDAAGRPPMPIVITTGAGPQLVNRSTGVASPITQSGSGDAIGPAPTADQRNRQTGRQSALAVLDSIDELSARINTGNGALAKISGAAERAKAQANLNDDVSEYEALISGFTPLLARALGHSGVLTEQDVQSVRDLYPKVTDSKSIRDRKIARIRKIMESMPEAGASSSGGSSVAPPTGRYNPATGKVE